jgi:hypothetical protein
MDRKRSYLGLGSEIAESKTIEYPLIFTPPPTKLTKFIVDQFLLDGGFHFKFPVPGCNFTVEIDEYCTPHQIIFFLDLVFEDAFTLINGAVPRTAGEFDVAEESYEVPEGIDTSQYKCAFVKFLSEFQEEDTHSYIFRLLRGSFRVDEARKPMSVTLRMKGRSKEGKKEKLGILLPFTNDPLGILLPFNDLLNACPISTNSPVRFSHGPHLSPEFRHGHIELHLHLFKLPDEPTDRPVVQIEEVEAHTTFEELRDRVLMKHGWHVSEFRDRFSSWKFEQEGDYKEAISEVVFEHQQPVSSACDCTMVDSAIDRRYVLRTYCELSP